MRILHVNLSDASGGAAIACARLHQGLLSAGVDSQLLVYAVVDHSDPRVHALSSGLDFQCRRVLQKITIWLSKLQQDPQSFHCSPNLSGSSLLKRIDSINPDLVHLHWVGANILPIESLSKIRQPIVWTHHDMWPFCGAEHYSYDERWLEGYTTENRAASARGIDWNRLTWQRKYRAWRDVPVAHVGPSSWIRDCAANSKLWKGSKGSSFHVIPNGLDLDVFVPQDRLACRRELGLREDAPTLLFGAHSQNSSIKGGDLLYEVLQQLADRGIAYQLVTFGGGAFEAPDGIECVNLGSIRDVETLAKVYNAADVMMVPSRLEAFGQTASEAQACGIPVACFDTSGLRDIVLHKKDGYRAIAFDINDFVAGVLWCLDLTLLSLNERIAKGYSNPFELSKCAAHYIALYEESLNYNGHLK